MNIFLADKTREIDVVLQRKKIIILPGSFVKKFTDLIIAMLSLYVLFSTPLYIAFFEGEEYMNITGIVFESIFCFLFLLVIFSI